jgi:iron complex outermembrane receptor protein
VVTYFADVPISGAGAGLFYDLESVQVAAGPQGTLFGKNTTGGAVLFVPKKPVNDFEGSVEFGMGNYNMKTATAVVNVPLVDDKVLLRVAGQFLDRDGFTIDRGPFFAGKDYDNRDYWALRVSLLLRPFDNLENTTIFNALHSEGNGDGFVLTAANPAGAFGSLLLPIFRSSKPPASVRLPCPRMKSIDDTTTALSIPRTGRSASSGNLKTSSVIRCRNGVTARTSMARAWYWMIWCR